MKVDQRHSLWAVLCVLLAGLMLFSGWLVPAHLRAIDNAVLQRAGTNQASLIDRGLTLVQAKNPGAANLILLAAQKEKIPGAGELESTLTTPRKEELLFPGGPTLPLATPVTTVVIQSDNRERLLAYLETTGRPAVHELLRARELTNTVLFAASHTASGQAFDAAISVGGLLLADSQLTPGLQEAIVARTASAATHTNAQPLEEILMDFLSLGQRLSWGQLKVFVSDVNDPSTLASLAAQARDAGAQLPVLFSAVALSQEPEKVTRYLNDYSQTGLRDLTAGLRQGKGGLNELLQRHQRVYFSAAREAWLASPVGAFCFPGAASFALRAPRSALFVKWLLYLLAGFLLAAAGHFVRPAVAEIERPLQVRGVHVVRAILFALGFLLVVLLLSEPFLAQDSQKAEFAFRLRLPLAGATTAGLIPAIKTKLMDTRSLITLALFFVLQGLIYCACLAKLAEIRRQKVPPRIQLKLLENEEHLFDGGLYLGFAGTIVCLIFVSLGVIQQSLMAAYSSTSFGIIFVSIFKIFNLRPVRRRLLMQAEYPSAAPAPAISAEPSLVSTP